MAIKTKKVEVPDHELEHENKTVKLYRQQHPLDPLELPSPVILELSHGRYDLGNRDANTDDHDGWAGVEEEIRDDHDVIAIKKVYLLDHGGLRISTTPFRSKWDSGKVGFAYVTEESLPDYSDSEHDRPDQDKIRNWIDDRVKQYDQYLRGEVYRYEIEKDGEEIDRCGGFYGDPMENEVLWEHVGDPRDKFETVD